MPLVTTVTLESGDRPALDAVVDDLRREARRKGIELKGPHTHPPDTLTVPRYRGLHEAHGEYPPWEYTVYRRTIEIAGHDETVRRIAEWEFPRGIHAELEINHVRSVGSR